MNYFWYHRILEVIALVGGLIVLLFLWNTFTNQLYTATLHVSILAGVCAIITTIDSVFAYFFLSRKLMFEIVFGCFCLFTVTLATLIIGSDGLSSPFIVLWILPASISGVFGLWGMGPYLILAAAYAVNLSIHKEMTPASIVFLVLVTVVPVIISSIVWREASSKENRDEQAYENLATKLSQVAGESDVVINAIADGVIATDGSGVIELINPAAQHLLGWKQRDALKLSYKSIIKLIDAKGDEISQANDPVSKVLSTNELFTSDNMSLVTNSGKKILVSLYVSPVGPAGSGVIIVFRDITNEKAEERQQAEFISTASHEMRTPVASIEGYLGLALNPATASIDEKARSFITKAHESAQHLGRLFQDLLDVSRADDGRLQNNPKVIDTVAYLHDIVEGLRPKADEKGLTLIYKPQPDNGRSEDPNERTIRTLAPIYYIQVDPDHLREIVANLVENGIKYTPRGSVTIDITGDAENVRIEVTDSGIGIPPEDIGHLFQKFYRIDNSETREIGGTGLGLYLSRRLAETMNGRIWVESEYKKGSTFFVSFPRLANDEATRILEQAAQAPQPTTGQNTPTPQPSVTTVPAPTPAAQGLASTAAPSARDNTPLSVIEQSRTNYQAPRQPNLSIPGRPENGKKT